MAALDQRALRGRAADVEREHVRLPDQPAELGGAPEPARGARLDHRDRDLLRLVDGVHAGVRLQNVELPREAGLAHTVGEAREVPLGNRLHVGREHSGARALVLAPLAGDRVRGDDGDLRPQLADALEHRLLMARVGVGVEQADGDRLDALGLEVLDDRRNAAQVERRALAAVVREPARHLAPQVARHERRRLHVVEVEVVGAIAARDLERVAEALSGDQRRLHALALGDRVDDERGAVREEADVSARDAALRDHVEDAALEVGRRRSGLRGQDLLPAGLGVGRERHEVGERPTDVRRHAEGAHGAFLPDSCAAPETALLCRQPPDCPAGSPCLPSCCAERSP